MEPKSRLITDVADEAVYTARRDTDARTALLRGMADYLRTLTFPAPAGGMVEFQKVLETWSETENPAVYPSACVYTPNEGVYDAIKLTPDYTNRFPLPDGTYLVSPAEFTLDFMVDVYTTQPTERMAIVAMLEDAFSPVDWMNGFRLELPHYFNERATYELLRSAYADTEVDTTRRWRRATLTVRGNVPYTRVFTRPQLLQTQTKTTVGTDTQV